MNKKLWLGCIAVASVSLFLLSNKANAEIVVDTVGVHIGSHHWPASAWNNVNPGLYVQGTINSPSGEVGWGPGNLLPNGRYVAGGYYNSERRGSAYVGYVYPVTSYLDVVVGAITGYKAAPILPLVVPSVHVGLGGGWSARLNYLPKIESSGAHVLHLSLERKF